MQNMSHLQELFVSSELTMIWSNNVIYFEYYKMIVLSVNSDEGLYQMLYENLEIWGRFVSVDPSYVKYLLLLMLIVLHRSNPMLKFIQYLRCFINEW